MEFSFRITGLFLGLAAGLTGSSVCFGQTDNTEIPTHYTFVPRQLSKEGDYKVVVVAATNPRQARLDAQTYHIGWDAIEARMGQSRVMYDVLLKKRKPYVPGTPPVTRPIPKERKR
ncbi:MAG: hypothetical protein LBH00_01285 [Planctomycetaceae bacterium]|jgi:hypothetical protein|nr:hypothetical protein [Planctomycetaceae bacterium]